MQPSSRMACAATLACRILPSPSTRIDAGAQAVHRLRQRCRLVLLEADDLGNHRRTPDVRRDQAHAPACLLIDNAVPLMPEHPEHRGLGGRLLQKDADEIDQPLRLCPFPIETGLEEFVVGNEIGRRCRLFDGGKTARRQRRIERDVFLEIELPIFRRDSAVVEKRVAAVVGRIVPVDRRRLPLHEIRRLLQGGGPERPVEHRVVDFGNHLRQLLAFLHISTSTIDGCTRGPDPQSVKSSASICST